MMKAMSESPNRRKAVRWKARVECRYEHQGQWHEGQMFDLSEKGSYLQSQQALPERGSSVTIRFRSLDGQRELSTTGVVRHRRLNSQGTPQGFGVEFEQPSPEVLAELESIITQPTFLKNRSGG